MSNFYKLSNGVRVGCFESGGASTAVAVISSFLELPSQVHSPLAPFILEKIAFTQTLSSNPSALQKRMDAIVGGSQVKSHREYIRYGTLTTPKQLPSVLQILAEVATQPVISNSFLNDELEPIINYEVAEMKDKNPESFMAEMMVHAGFGSRLFSLAKAQENFKKNSLEETVSRFTKAVVQPNKLIVLAAGPDINLVENLREAIYKSGIEDLSLLTNGPESVTSFSYNPQNPDDCIIEDSSQKFTHVSVGFEGIPKGDPDSPVASVLATLLGGGGSFSAGGPGKGMYSRLYTQVLNRIHWVESVHAFSLNFSTSGLFGIHGSCPTQHSQNLVRTMLSQLHSMAHNVTEEELNRAKNIAASGQLMNTETRFNLVDVAAETLLYKNKAFEPVNVANEIQTIEKKDLQRVAERILKSKPCIAVFGRIPSRIPSPNLN
jgi:mitochondrial-processing peptidase subunit alpha